MANNDLKISEMPLVDGVVEGDVVPAVHNGENVAVNGKFFDDLANGIVDLNDDMNATKASVAALQGEVAGKQDALTTSADLSISDNNELSLTDMAKKRLFIDMWNTACGTYGQYNATTGFFELNGLTDITYQQALDIYAIYNGECRADYTQLAAQPNMVRPNARTLLPINAWIDAVVVDRLASASTLEVLRFASSRTNQHFKIKHGIATNFVDISAKLKAIYCDTGLTVLNKSAIYNCPVLENLELAPMYDFNIKDSPNLSLYSCDYMVMNAANGSTPITITVHPDVYAKLTDTTNTEWHAVLTAAAAKNISFATV